MLRTAAIVLPPGLPATAFVDDVTPPGPHTIDVDASGYATLPLSNLPITRVIIDRPGYQTYEQNGVRVPVDGNFQFRIGVPPDPARPQDVLLPPLVPLAPPVPHLEQRGNDFVDAQGRRVVYPGMDGFPDLYLATIGRTAQLDALTPDTKLVTITIGGNDLNYLARLTSASCEGLKAQGVAGDCRPAPPMPTREDYDALKGRMAQIATEVRRRAPQARLVFVDYLTVLPPIALCPGAPMRPEDAAIIREIARGLAKLTAETAKTYNADVIRASALSTGHDACSASPWMNGYPRPGAPINGAAYHPNLAGMTAVALALQELLR